MEIRRIFDTLANQLEDPLDIALASKRDGEWITYSTHQIVDIVNQLSLGLLEQGIQPGDKIALASFNRVEWVFVDLAMAQLGAINVPMYPNSTSDDYRYIMENAEVKMIFAGDQAIADKLDLAIADIPRSLPVYTFDHLPEKDHWKSLMKEGDYQLLDKYRSEIDYEDLATIIYTSGTTGNPKGVMLSHRNILSNASAVRKAFPHIDRGERTLSFLPLCHIFERTALYTYLQMGISIYYAESMDTIAENLKEVKPYFFITVPRLLEKVYDKILTKGYELTGFKKSLFFWALNLGLRYELNSSKGLWYTIQLALANKLVFSKWREALGGNVKFVVSGAAALQPRIAKVFWSAKIKVLEAYGLTETSPGVSFSLEDRENIRIGCVGPLLEGVQVKIADDGEILVKGPNVMMGYYKQPQATQEVIDNEGWFHTGDVGEMVEGKFLKITDRKKEIFKTSGGKYIAPQYLENKFKESLFIEHIVVVGENRKFPAALIVPSIEALKEWCEKKKIVFNNAHGLLDDKRVLQKIETEVEKLNQHFARFERIKRYKLLVEPWSIEGGELTPTLKLKRKSIHLKYKNQIDGLYK